MRKRKLLTLLVSICLVLSLAAVPFMSACEEEPPPGEQEEEEEEEEEEVEPIKIGVLAPLTGPFSMWGEMFVNSMKLALDEADWEIAGRTIELLVEDEGGVDPTIALDKAKKLVEADKVDVILGPFYASMAYAVMPYTSSVPIVNIKWSEPSSDADELDNPYAFWTPLSYSDTTYPLGLYAYDELGIRTVTTLGSDFSCGYDFVGGLTNAFESRGGQVIQQQWHPLEEADFAPYLTGVEIADAFVCGALGVVPKLSLFPQYEELGLFEQMPTILMSEVGPIPPDIIEELGGLIEGIYAPNTYLMGLDNPENQAFVPAYQAAYNQDPDDKAVTAYNCMKILLAALEATGGDADPDVLKQALLDVEIKLPTGDFRFSPGRIGVHDLHICQMQYVDGKLQWVLLETYPEREPTITTYP